MIFKKIMFSVENCYFKVYNDQITCTSKQCFEQPPWGTICHIVAHGGCASAQEYHTVYQFLLATGFCSASPNPLLIRFKKCNYNKL